MKSTAPDIAQIPLPIDHWTRPFWDSAARHELVLPRCDGCKAWRWPPTPFCPHCQLQTIEWLPAGPARLYSFTILHRAGPTPDAPRDLIVPGLVEFPEAGGMRLVVAIIDSEIDDLVIGHPMEVRWIDKDDTCVPVFAVAR